ncbi:MAG: hypothetical protein RL007_876 [Bacteroidota bacterium]|jgi:hypothetical protein
MKKIALSIFAIVLSLTFVPQELKASTDLNSVNAPGDSVIQKQILLDRLSEIQSTDKSDLSFNEKRNLRKEEREIKTTLNRDYGGVYISVGAFIVIILLLIIFF